MVGRGTDVCTAEAGGEGVALGSVGRVDDAGYGVEALALGFEFRLPVRVGTAPGMHALQPRDEGGEAAVVLVGGEADFVVQVGPGGGGCESFEGEWVEGEGGDDVGADAGGGGRGEADYRGGGVGGAEVGELDVGGAEVVAPFADTWGELN